MVLSDLALKIKEMYGLENTLLMNISEFNVFSDMKEDVTTILSNQKCNEGKNIIYGDPFTTLDEIKINYDFIIGNLPMGWLREEYVNKTKGIRIKERKNWIILLKSLFLLSEKGKGIFLLEPSFIDSHGGIKFIELLNNNDFYIEAIFNAPEGILKPTTGIRPVIVVFSRKENNNRIFAAELNDNLDIILDNWINNNSIDITRGIFLDFDTFKGFEKYKIIEYLDKLSCKYNEFKKYSIKELYIDINIGSKIVEKENSIYIPRVGNSKVISNIKDSKLKHQNLIQIILDEEKVHAKYLELFFNTKIGILTLKTLYSGSAIPNINRKDIDNLIISVPGIELQKIIIDSHEKLEQLKIKIDTFEQEIALNPNSVESIQNDLNKMLYSLNLLNEADNILSLIREGENKKLEFKSTLRKSIEREGIPDYIIEHASLKTIAGFLNSEGGILLVGVNDKGVILGLDNDGFKSNDELLKHVKNLIHRDFNSRFYELINYSIVNVENKQILIFKCEPSDKPVFLGKKDEFFIRTNPATDSLTGEDIYEYIISHFKLIK